MNGSRIYQLSLSVVVKELDPTIKVKAFQAVEGLIMIQTFQEQEVLARVWALFLIYTFSKASRRRATVSYRKFLKLEEKVAKQVEVITAFKWQPFLPWQNWLNGTG